MAGIGAFLIATKSYRLRRITGFLDPWADPLDSGFQLIQSLIAFGTGGIFGRGLGNSKQKLFFLPESHSDFIFSIIAEETGFVGVAIVTGLFLVLAFKGIRIALECENDFGRNLAFGITIMIVLQSLFNIGVVVGLLPTKGIPLPFISYGGSSLVVNMLMIGVLVNISGGGKPKS
ncbi:MAG: FtsW/RodA/SpoVE family cell cycle protein [Deltaproteobacteria bacterium]|nr:FtsW/RodA/SpoVE family cell cycle protein [Deltaproteobacteria bacterium]